MVTRFICSFKRLSFFYFKPGETQRMIDANQSVFHARIDQIVSVRVVQ
jgi:hypothetical protein